RFSRVSVGCATRSHGSAWAAVCNTAVTLGGASVAQPQQPAANAETSRGKGASRTQILGGDVDGYYAFMLVATALVLMMTIPALALFYGGMSRSKSVLNMMMMSYVALAIVAIVYVLW